MRMEGKNSYFKRVAQVSNLRMSLTQLPEGISDYSVHIYKELSLPQHWCVKLENDQVLENDQNNQVLQTSVVVDTLDACVPPCYRESNDVPLIGLTLAQRASLESSFVR